MVDLDSSIQDVFLFEIKKQCELALLAFSELEATVNATLNAHIDFNVLPQGSIEEYRRTMEQFNKKGNEIRLYQFT